MSEELDVLLIEIRDAIDRYLQRKIRKVTVQEVRDAFPSELRDKLSFSESETEILVKPKKYLGKESFVQVASIVKGLGGEYVSAGRESHFRIAKEKRK